MKSVAMMSVSISRDFIISISANYFVLGTTECLEITIDVIASRLGKETRIFVLIHDQRLHDIVVYYARYTLRIDGPSTWAVNTARRPSTRPVNTVVVDMFTMHIDQKQHYFSRGDLFFQLLFQLQLRKINFSLAYLQFYQSFSLQTCSCNCSECYEYFASLSQACIIAGTLPIHSYS